MQRHSTPKMTIEDRVVAQLNTELGPGFNALTKSDELVRSYRADLDRLATKLTLSDESCAPELKNAVQSCSWKYTELEEAADNLEAYEEKLLETIDRHSEVMSRIDGHLKKIKKLENMKEYFLILLDIQNIGQELTVTVNGKDENKTISLYVALSGNLSNSILDRLQGVEAPHLKMYARNTAFYWHDILKEKFSKEFEAILKTIKWPNLNQSLETFNPSKENISKLIILAEYLFLVKVPGDQNLLNVKLTPSIICPPFTTVTELLLKPFRLRFQFHFSGNKQTNRLDKPEWYFTQILSWAKENHVFVGQNFQSAALRAGVTNHNVRLEFIRGLVQLAIEKLVGDIDSICQEETVFAHLIDEVLAFEQELKSTLGYPTSLPSAISVLIQPKYLVKWMAIEEKFTTDKMDAMLKSDDPWRFLDPANLDDMKIPKCADQFICLLDAIKERYCALPQPGQQLQFLDLQLKLIDNFRRRLVQLHNSPGTDRVSSTKILNAINYITSVLQEWGENVHYLHLHAALYGPHTDEISSVFDKTIEELDHWQNTLVRNLSSRVVDEVKAKSRSYRHDIWPIIDQLDTKETFMLSATSSEMFQVLVNNLHNLESELSSNVFSIAIRLIALQLDEWLIDGMVMNTMFSTGGALQFQYDMTRNLFALFGQYARKPSLLFKRINDTCLLLTLPLGSALLLHETVSSEQSEEAVTSTLKEMGLMILRKPMVLEVLERRNDIAHS
ncbi:RINT1-like protein [Toxorhynchites rutilus septentrionalis]|uniref:RINT1-like protein n=1 Tax=Toxorhynchites rutilus septentrionalis TaxID=329112 RepID=UPI00247ABA38|nr:RINT1-like protein [Toxorhynchites rutilus septentrionalis]